MSHYYWNDWYTGWGWFLWIGVLFLIFFSFGNWGYTYRAHRKFENEYLRKDAVDILNARYARGEIGHEEYLKMKAHILPERQGTSPGGDGEKLQRSRAQANSTVFGK